MLGGGQLGRYAVLAARITGYGTVVLDPDPAAPAGAVADVHLVAAFDDAAALDELAARCAWSPPSSRTHRRPPCNDSPPTSSSPRPPGPWRSPRTASPRSRSSTGRLPGSAVCRAHRRRRPRRCRRSRRTAHRQDGPPRLRRQGPTVGRRRRRRRAAWRSSTVCRASSNAGCRSTSSSASSWPAGDGATATYPVGENVHRDGSSTSPSCRPGSTRRSAARRRTWRRGSPRRSTTSACWRSRCSSPVGACSSTSWRPGRTTAGTGHSMPRRRASSTSRSGPSPDAALGATEMTAPAAAMVNLLGDLWFDGRKRWSSRLGGGPRRPRRPACTSTARRCHGRAQDGPPHGRRRRSTRLPPERCGCAGRSAEIGETATPGGDDGPMERPPERIDPVRGVVLRRHHPATSTPCRRRSSRAATTSGRSCRGPTRTATTAAFVASVEGWPPARLQLPRHGAGGSRQRRAGGRRCGLHRRGRRGRSRSATGCVPTPSAAG